MKLDPDVYPYTSRADMVIRFLRGKLSPTAGFAWDVLEKENVVGEKLEPGDVAVQKTVPLYVQDIIDIVKEEGAANALKVGIPAFFGVGVQTYAPGGRELAKNTLRELSELPEEEAQKRYQEIKQTDPKLADSIKNVHQEVTLGIGDEERFMRQLPIERRAQVILDELENLSDDSERETYYNNLIRTKVITKDTQSAIIKLLSERSE